MTTPNDPVHPNLADALADEPAGAAPDAAALDALARRLGTLGDADLVPPAPAAIFAAIEAELAEPPTVVALTARRRPRAALVLGIAAAVLVGVVAAGVAWTGDTDSEPRREQIALVALPGFEGVTGTATLEVDGAARSVGVALTDVDVPEGSHLELWLLDAAVEELVPLGELAGTGPHQLPEAVDLTVTPIVDVSLEPDDGNPAHSGTSVARGSL